MKRSSFLILGVLLALHTDAQRTYTNRSVLSTGSWHRIAVSTTGVYRVDASLLGSMGFSLPLSSQQIRLFGNGGQMLSERNQDPRLDDLQENAIWLEDGGDGSFSGQDYFLFYAQGPDSWEKDSVNKRFSHRKNLYSQESCYYITIGAGGLRISEQGPQGVPGFETDRFDERYFYELDSLNFLSSGKEWFGEEFGSGPGQLATRNFSVNLPGLIANTPITVISEVIARSAGNPSVFNVQLNSSPLYQHNLPPLPGILYEPVASSSRFEKTTNLTVPRIQLGFLFSPGSVNGQGWLNWFELFCSRSLDMTGLSQLSFRNWSGIGPGQLASYRIRNAPGTLIVWDVTEARQPQLMKTENIPGGHRFTNDASRLREYIAINPSTLPQPRIAGKIPNQDLHRPQDAQMIILTAASLRAQAQKLADHHRQRDNIISVIADVQEVYNEFSSGIPDPAALRDYVKMFYDRAGIDSLRRPRFLLLFGDGSFDYKNRVSGNLNLVPTYQSPSSLDPLTTYTSDDFFGLLDDADDIQAILPVSLLDIGVGRIPASSPEAAERMVDKIIRYHAKASLGPWRNQLSFIADDEDQNTHFSDAEFHAQTVGEIDSVFNIQKTYMDAFQQESGAGGSRYPKVNESINIRLFNGTLIWNYSGHGGSRRLAQEAVLDEEMVRSWRNENRLPLFITATCDFAPFDNPLVHSIGEQILMDRASGGIALMTTTRLVFAFSNRIINNNYLRFALQPAADGRYPSLGEAVREAKNFTSLNSGDIINNRKFTLLGDPALTLGFQTEKVRVNTVNGIPIQGFNDTLKALNRYTIQGEVTDRNGLLLQDFNGLVYPSVYDKVQQQQTLANDPGSVVASFSQRQNLLYNGKVQALNGRFSFTFIVPKDINYQPGKGRLSFYAENGIKEAGGATDQIYVGGLGNEVADDGQGPGIKAWLNDEKFVNGGISNETPILLVSLADSSGINTVGTGIGHNLIAVLDGNTRETFVLNDFYETDQDSYQKGKIRFQLPQLKEGMHSLRIKAWDVFNNSSEYVLEFMVVKKEDLDIRHVLNYPNPFTTRTQFWFEHNRPMEQLRVTVQVMTVTGKLVKTIEKAIITTGNRSIEVEWDGRDDYGSKLGRGVYLYRLRVQTMDGKSREKLEKLLIL